MFSQRSIIISSDVMACSKGCARSLGASLFCHCPALPRFPSPGEAVALALLNLFSLLRIEISNRPAQRCCLNVQCGIEGKENAATEDALQRWSEDNDTVAADHGGGVVAERRCRRRAKAVHRRAGGRQ